MLKYLLILLAIIVFTGWVLYTWYKRQGVKGMATSTGQSLGILATVTGAVLVLFGKFALIFARAGVEADAERSEDSNNQLMGPFILDADDYGVGPGKDSKGNIYL